MVGAIAMQFSIQWAGVSVAYVGMTAGVVAGWRAATGESWLAYRIFAALAGSLFGGGAALPFVASNFLSALMAMWLARNQSFGVQFATFMIIALLAGWMVLRCLDLALAQMGGMHLDVATMMKALGFATATFALALFLMRFAPTHQPV